MGFMDSIKEALGGERGDDGEPSTDAIQDQGAPRHAARDVPAEAPEDSAAETGGKHAARE